MSCEADIEAIVARHREALQARILSRRKEVLEAGRDHHMAFAALGVSSEEAADIDLHQSVSRLVYRHAGAMMEELACHCLKAAYPDGGKVRIPNPAAGSPATYEIDFLARRRDAIEIKWRDATTDGDHVRKENARLQATIEAGYRPVRLMFFLPTTAAAAKIQARLQASYKDAGGIYAGGAAAFAFISRRTGVDLRGAMQKTGRPAQ
ncbi:ApaLI family restriction endonuclease [Roseivivax sp. CAU 1761]